MTISKAAMKMIQEEAVAAFWDHTNSTPDPQTFTDSQQKIDDGVSVAVKHALEHALEEGIVWPPPRAGT
jgi:hypothetical protein